MMKRKTMAGTCQYRNHSGVHKGKGATAIRKAAAPARAALSINLRHLRFFIATPNYQPVHSSDKPLTTLSEITAACNMHPM
jgi:hypothetical protein